MTVPTGANHSVAETGATLGKYASSLSCTDGTTGGTSASGITVTAGQTTVCTLTNTRKADLAVTKTEGGSTTLSRTWTFTLSGGPDQIELTRSTADGNPVGFGSLAPGEYTLCEVDLPDGWHSSLGVAAGGKVCTQLQLAAGESGEFTVDTTPAIGLLKQVRRGR